MVLDDDALPSFGTVLKGFRIKRCLTQQQLATKLGVRRNTVGNWERGDYLPANKAQVLELARHLHLNEQETRQLLEASLTALAPYWSVPLPRNPYFSGREEVLEALHTQLGIAQAVALTQPSALQGLGGVGKTQIALEYASRYALEYRAVFWIEAETSEQITSSLLRLADVLGLPQRHDADQQQVLGAVRRWLMTHHHWLLIWDNLEDPMVLSDFLPLARQGVFLITTRCAALGTLAQGIELLPMRQEEGVLFLLRRAKVLSPAQLQQQIYLFATPSPNEYAAAEAVVSILGGLPLALDQAGAYIDETRCGFSGYLQRYEQQRSQLLARRGALSVDHPQSVVSTFFLACQRIAQQNPAALELLRFCAWLSPDAIPEECFLTHPMCLGPVLGPVVADPLQFDQALGALLSLSLVHRHPETRMLSIHRLVQIVLREAMNECEQVQWLLRALQVLTRLFPEVSVESPTEVWGQCERLLPHMLAMSAALTDGSGTQELAEVLSKAADYLRERAQYDQAEPLYTRALTLYEHTGEKRPLPMAHVLNGLASLYTEQRKYAQAEHLSQRALQIQEQALGVEHPEITASLMTLANLYWQQGRYAEAEPLFQQSLFLREQAYGGEHPLMIVPLSRLGLLYWRQGRYAQAEPLFRRALALSERVERSERPQMIQPLTNLGLLCWKQGRYAQAEHLFRQAIRIWEQVFGLEHHLMAYTLMGLAIIYAEQGKNEQAEGLFQRALHIREQALGPEHPLVAVALNNLAELSIAQEKYEQGERLYQRAIALYEQRGETEHKDLAYPLHGLAKLYAGQGKEAQAEPLYRRALHLWEQAGEDPTIATALGDLAQLYLKQAKDEEAEQLYQRALSMRLQSLGHLHLETAQMFFDFALLQHKRGKRDEALSLVQQAFAIRSELVGEAHSDTIIAQALAEQLLQEQADIQDEAAASCKPEKRALSGKNHQTAETLLVLDEIVPFSKFENDAFREFLTACCDLHPGAWCRSADLWQAYQQWAKTYQGRYPLSRGAFIAQLKAHGCRAARTKVARIWRGIALVESPTMTEGDGG